VTLIVATDMQIPEKDKKFCVEFTHKSISKDEGVNYANIISLLFILYPNFVHH
jgi:hypothetical protein